MAFHLYPVHFTSYRWERVLPDTLTMPIQSKPGKSVGQKPMNLERPNETSRDGENNQNNSPGILKEI